jgi:NADH-quinone oxidoreductase subunit C
MTVTLAASEVAAKLSKLAGSIIESKENTLIVKSGAILDILSVLKDTPGLELNYLNDITATDYWDYFELVYQLTSLNHNHKLTVKTRLAGRKVLSLPSVISVFRGADFQEREIHDLLGIAFAGHPNLKPIILWEGFQGYPLRKDFL